MNSIWSKTGSPAVVRRYTPFLLVAASVLLIGCSQLIRPQAPSSQEMSSPVSGVVLGFEPISIAIQDGTPVGGKALNPKSPYQREYHYGQSFKMDAAELTFSLKDELVQQGYQLAQGENAKRWRIRATVVNIVHNIFGSQSRLGWSEAQVTVDWHLSGPRDIRLTTVGVANARKHTRASIFQAWRKAIRAFGGHKRVVAALRTDLHAGIIKTEEPLPVGVQRVVHGKSASTRPLKDEEILQRVSQSVVAVVFRDRKSVGVVISDGGLIVTALSAVQGTPSVVVVNAAGQRTSGRIVAIDPEGQTALISTKSALLSPIAFRLSSDTLGERVLILGPQISNSKQGTVASGFITSTPPGLLDTNVSADETLLGSPIVDGFGRLVGLVTGYASSANMSAQGVPTNRIFSGLNITVL